MTAHPASIRIFEGQQLPPIEDRRGHYNGPSTIPTPFLRCCEDWRVAACLVQLVCTPETGSSPPSLVAGISMPCRTRSHPRWPTLPSRPPRPIVGSVVLIYRPRRDGRLSWPRQRNDRNPKKFLPGSGFEPGPRGWEADALSTRLRWQFCCESQPKIERM